MTPIQQLMLGVGASKKTYLDDVFSTFLYKGQSTPSTVTTGIDMTEGGMVWVKNRSTGNHAIGTKELGSGYLTPNGTGALDAYGNGFNTFTSTGFTTTQGNQQPTNENGNNYASWSWKKTPGFFDVVTYAGNDTAGRQVSHSLGSVPGLILVKKTTSGDAANWQVYHRSLGATKYLNLNTSGAAGTASNRWDDTEPTATHFTLGSTHRVNNNGDSYVAYLFAGGESNASEARSVDFDGSGNLLTIADNAAWDLGNGDFTLETWIKSTQTTSGYFTALGQWSSGSSNSWGIRYASQDVGTGWSFFYSTNGSNYTTTMGSDISDGQWHHIAVTRTGGKLRTFTDGVLNTTRSTTDTFFNGTTVMKIGGQGSAGNYFDGQLSNLRLVKGTAVYTSSFRPPTEPLTNITNTVLLMCNNSSYTGSTVTPAEIVNMGDATASTDSPFDDPAGFVFGDSKEGIIKCGSFRGHASGATPFNLELGWEPQFLMVKNSTTSNEWLMFDSMRGTVTDGNDRRLSPTESSAEHTSDHYVEFHPTGVNITSNDSRINGGTSETIVYMAIRRPDGYVGKPADAGTDVFAIDTGNSSSTIPNFDSGFPVDFAWAKLTGSANHWYTSARLIQGKELLTDSTSAEGTGTNKVFDSNAGWHDTNGNSGYISHMWKRHAGFDVVAFEGTNINNLQVPHGLNAVPEMIWIKNRDASENWGVYHKGLNNGTNPEQYVIRLNSDNPEFDHNEWWNDTAPTSTHFTVGIQGETNGAEKSMLAVLFSSVSGVSKVGHYSGTGSGNHSITTGFQPRFILIKPAHRADGYGGGWSIFDTLRGINSGTERPLRLNYDSAESSQSLLDYIDLDSDGFTLQSTSLSFNGSNARYIYYAHA